MDGTGFPTRWPARMRAALGTLKARITLAAMLALALGIGSISWLLVHRAERDTLRAQQQRELSEVARTAGLVSGNVIDRQRDLQAVSLQMTPELLAGDAALAHFLEGQRVLRAHFTSILVFAPDGRMRAMADAKGVSHPSVDASDRDYFRRTVAENRPIVSEAISGRVSSEPIVVLTYPLRHADAIVGVVSGVLRLGPDDLIPDLVNAQDSDAEALQVLTTADGQVLAHPDRSRVMHSLADEPRLAKAFATWKAAGATVEPLGVNVPQVGEVVSAAGVSGLNWVVWRSRTEADLLGPLRAARGEAMGWAAQLIALLSVTMLAFLWWLLRPLALLELRAQHLFDGHFEHDAHWPDPRDEIGRLGRVLRHVGAERALLESFNSQVLRKLGSVMSAAPIGIAFTRERRFELVSTEFCRLFGYTEGELLGQATRFIYPSDEEFARVGPLVGEAFAAHRPYCGEWQLMRADGSLFWASLRGSPVDAVDQRAGVIWIVGDISDQKVEHAQLEFSATHDPLTALANRKLFEQRAHTVVTRLERTAPAALIFIDLDHFKPINDTAGHAAGDAVLRAVGAALTSNVRASDLVARLGGDEFALLLDGCTPEAAMRVAEAVRSAIAGITVAWEGRTLGIGASLGIAWLGTEVTSVAGWLAAADAACYAAKAAGRGVVRTSAPQAVV